MATNIALTEGWLSCCRVVVVSFSSGRRGSGLGNDLSELLLKFMLTLDRQNFVLKIETFPWKTCSLR